MTDQARPQPALSRGDDPLLVVDNLSISYVGRRSSVAAVKGVGFSLRRGEIFALVGASGSGKSSVCSALCGLLPARASVSADAVRLDDVRLDSLDARGWQSVRGRRVALVPQQPVTALVPTVSVGRQLDWYLGRDAVAAYETELRALGLNDVVERPRDLPDDFSGGQLQRLVVAMATLAHQPQLLLADEPTSALDRETQEGVLALLREHCDSRGAAAVVVSHDLSVVARHCHRVGVMHEGALVEVAEVDELFKSPQHPDSRALVEAAMPQTNRRPRLKVVSSEAMAPLLEIRDLSHRYGAGPGSVPALEGVNLTVSPGEVVAIVGPSGSGKSTLARVVVGLLRPDRGSLTLAGRSLTVPRTASDRRVVRHVGQDPRSAFNRNRTLRHALAQAQRACGLGGGHAERAARSGDALRRVGLGPQHLDRRPGDLSGGELARAVLARALLGEPRLLVLDEPTASLDARVRAEVLDLLADLRANDGVSMLVITHDPVTARVLADRVVMLEAGRVVRQGNDVSDRPPRACVT